MKDEGNEALFTAIQAMASHPRLISRNDNDELIAIEYCNALHTLSRGQLYELERLWARKCRLCRREKRASRRFVFQMIVIMAIVFYIALMSAGPLAGAIAGSAGVIVLLKIIDDARIRRASGQLADAIVVHRALLDSLRAR